MLSFAVMHKEVNNIKLIIRNASEDFVLTKRQDNGIIRPSRC